MLVWNSSVHAKATL